MNCKMTKLEKIKLLQKIKELHDYQPAFLKNVEAQLMAGKELGHNSSQFIERMFQKYYPNYVQLERMK